MQLHAYLLRDKRILAISATLIAATGALALAMPSMAAPTGQTQVAGRADVKAELKAFRIEGDKMVAADKAGPGDVIEYQARYTNSGTGAAQSFSPQLPIPDALVYAGNSAMPSDFLASTDGKNFAPAPLMRSVKAPDGTTKMIAVPLKEYRSLRWKLGTLAPGQSVTIKARARVKTLADEK